MFINVTDRAGERHTLEALEGFRIMEIIRDWGLDIKAECDGACACATCHVYVDETWARRLVEPNEEEVDRLDEAFDVADNSRLSCQILMRPEFDGIELKLAPGSER
jgi:2Fe-2S ferredoxin